MRLPFLLIVLCGALFCGTAAQAQVVPPSPQNRPEAAPANTPAPAPQTAAPPVVPQRTAPPLSGDKAEKARERLEKEREKAARDAERNRRRD